MTGLKVEKCVAIAIAIAIIAIAGAYALHVHILFIDVFVVIRCDSKMKGYPWCLAGVLQYNVGSRSCLHVQYGVKSR